VVPSRPLYRALAEALRGLGVEAVFGVMGEDTAALTAAIIEAGIVYRGARHESVAVAMADGYSWAAERVGVAMVTRGPGLMNAVTACRTAVQGGRRVLLICGDAAAGADHRFDYKFIDQGPIAASVGMGYMRPTDAGHALDALEAAMASAISGRPVVLAIGVDLFGQEVESAVVRPTAVPPPTAGPPPPADGPPRPGAGDSPQPAELDRLVEILSTRQRPLVLAGRGAVASGAGPALAELARRIGGLLGTTLQAKDLFAGNPLDLGVVGSFASDPAAELLAVVDCVVSFGASLTPFTTGQRTLFTEASVVQIDRDPACLGATFPITLGIVADAALAASALVSRFPGADGDGAASRPFHSADTLEQLRRPLFGGADASAAGELDPRTVAVMLDRLLPRERSVVLDSGRFMTSPARFIRVPGPQFFRLTAEAGSIAIGLGVALGATAARPGCANVLFVGDGALSMTLGDLETAARHSLALTVVVMNDRAYGAEYVHLEADGLPSRYAALPEIDFAAAARALGVEAVRVGSIAELEALASRLAGRNAPLLVDCRIRQDITAARLRW
jgi:acetolactate synthase I/II/III large subunit